MYGVSEKNMQRGYSEFVNPPNMGGRGNQILNRKASTTPTPVIIYGWSLKQTN